MKNERIKTIAYWVTTIFGPFSFVIGGYLHMTHNEQVMGTITNLGYPAYFATFLGIGKLLGAIITVIPRFPRLKEWAYAGFFIDLTCAAASSAYMCEGLGRISQPLFYLALVMASWALRPQSRKLLSK